MSCEMLIFQALSCAFELRVNNKSTLLSYVFPSSYDTKAFEEHLMDRSHYAGSKLKAIWLPLI